MRSLSLLLLVPLAVACSDVAPTAVPPASGCSPETLARYTGLVADDTLVARMKSETGRTAVRLVKPGMAVTMDYREDRLTVYVDAANKVERANCG